MKPVICIAGPTASGKSAWAIELAKTVDGEVINADSMQVYKDLHILSARPDEKEMENIPHHLFGHVDGQVRYSTGRWLRDVVPVILDCLARQKTPILVGGTGLYFKALTEGLAAIPQPSAEAIDRAEHLRREGFEKLRQEAERVDPVAFARVLGDDPQRLMRIVSVALGTDHPLSVWQRETRPVIPKGYWVGAVLLPDREKLYDRIDKRYVAMVSGGGLVEAKSLFDKQLAADLPVMKAIGVPPLLEFIMEKISLEEAVFQAQRDTRRFAKRQFTWFRGQAKHWFCVNNAASKGVFRQKISEFSI